jgi:hypothetical protein
MLNRLRKHVTYSNVIASIALFAALGLGTAFAASKLANNAVKTKNIKNNAVKTTKIANGAVTTPKIADAAITDAKLAAGAVTGAKAGAGVLRDMIIVEDREPDAGETDTASKQAFANCPTGYVVAGGGYRVFGDADHDDIVVHTSTAIVDSAPGRRQWFAQGDHNAAGLPGDDWALLATAICVRG